ncbi:hypothetical protein, partial [Flavobacterium sp.]|uniref:hypothetical protein n=1 Tax=Flavobacterium sp. TaxID=239 RepID=UPI00286BFBD2
YPNVIYVVKPSILPVCYNFYLLLLNSLLLSLLLILHKVQNSIKGISAIYFFDLLYIIEKEDFYSIPIDIYIGEK